MLFSQTYNSFSNSNLYFNNLFSNNLFLCFYCLKIHYQSYSQVAVCCSVPASCRSIVREVTTGLKINPVFRFWGSLRGPGSVNGLWGSLGGSGVRRGRINGHISLYVPIRVCLSVNTTTILLVIQKMCNKKKIIYL